MTDIPYAVGVVGGGRMGAGIAQAFLQIGAQVHLVERDPAVAEAAGDRVTRGLTQARQRGTLQDAPDEVARRLRLSTTVTSLPADVDLVVEAVPEQPGLKVEVLTAVEDAVSEHTVLASNTSSLSITELGSALRRPERFLGMHFFNPVAVSTLVELVLAPTTDEQVSAAARRWVRALGKTEVVVNDSPGFATSRLGVLLGLEAIRMLEQGVASAEAIDTAMVLGYRHPVGPLRLTDLVGLDVRLAIAEYLHGELGDRFAPPKLLRDRVAAGHLGRKSGQGFFTWL